MATQSKPITEHARTAKLIRKKLAALYPYTTFRVRSRSFSGGNDVRISWTDGPTEQEIQKLTAVHEFGHFDGMTDCYYYSNVHPNAPQVKYISTTRTRSDATYRAIVDQLNREWGWSLRLVARTFDGTSYLDLDPASDGRIDNGGGWRSNEIHRAFYATSLVCPQCKHPRQFTDAYCAECGVNQQPQDEQQAA